MATLACDVSYYQSVVDDHYPHPWLIFRACDGTFADPHFAANLAWAKRACADGRLAGYTVYVVFRPGVDVLGELRKLLGAPDGDVTVMVDIESWGGAISGDHSPALTELVNGLAGYLGDRRRVLAYGNSGDLAAIYPRRPSWLRLVVAGYSSVQPRMRGLIGWQYSDGTDRWPAPAGLPRASAPFGACDHNVFPDHTPTQLAAALGVGKNGASMSVTDKDAATIVAHKITSHGVTQTLAGWVANGTRNAKLALDAANDIKKLIAAPGSGLLALTASISSTVTANAKALAGLQASLNEVKTEVAALRAGQLNPITVPVSGSVVIGGQQ